MAQPVGESDSDALRLDFRTLALPEAVAQWSLTSLREKLIKIGAKVVRHARYAVFQMAEVAVPKQLFEEILRLIAGLRPDQAQRRAGTVGRVITTGGVCPNDRGKDRLVDQTPNFASGAAKTSANTAQPACDLGGASPSATVQAVLEFIWVMSADLISLRPVNRCMGPWMHTWRDSDRAPKGMAYGRSEISYCSQGMDHRRPAIPAPIHREEDQRSVQSIQPGIGFQRHAPKPRSSCYIL